MDYNKEKEVGEIMGESIRRMRETGHKLKLLQPGQQIQLTPKQMESAKVKACECGCEYFMPAIKVSTISAIISPTGQELTTQTPVLVCVDCHKALG